MLALRIIGYGAIGLGILSLVFSVTESAIYVAPSITLIVSGVVFLAMDAVLVKLEQIRVALTPQKQRNVSETSYPSSEPENVVAKANGIKLQQVGNKMMARGITFNTVEEFKEWAQSQPLR